MLRGLKYHSENITAIVAVTDDGGGSGILRKDLGMPPPGDVRNCIQALANTEPTMEKLLAYRFTEGSLRGQSFGNLFLAALNGMSETFDEAVRKMSDVLAITGRVLPVTNENVHLAAEFDDGTEILGESKIAEFKLGTDKRITKVKLIPERPCALPMAIEAIEQAEMIIIGPGSLYTSIMPNLITEGIAQAVAESDAFRIYVLNIMTQDGETEHYTASDHIAALFGNSGERLFDWCLANSAIIPEKLLARYAAEGAEPVYIDEAAVSAINVRLQKSAVATWKNGFIRHDPVALAGELMCLYRENSQTRIYS
ncbi:MAG: YvcK family protein [Clostridia bacterium]|nr:YvcK family protein [Clostridia bacterium]